MFLDVDGVITSVNETPGSYINHTPEDYGPSPSLVARVIGLCESVGAKVVISSNWRKHKRDGLCGFRAMYRGKVIERTVHNPLNRVEELFGDLIIGSLPPVRHTTKAEALILWLEENDLSTEDISFVIFDDDPRENFQSTSDYGICKHFIMTDAENGISDEDVERAKAILNN